ncbi:MAG: hypothetical protein WD897_01265 [Parcubacteria group bacterium]
MYLSLALILSLATAALELNNSGRLIVVIPYGLLIPIFVLIPRFVMKKALESQGVRGEEWLKKMEGIIFLVILFNAPASLFFHSMGFQYDRFLHFAMGLASVPFFLISLLTYFRLIGKDVSNEKVLGFLFAFLFTGLFVWEGLQFSLDQIFATNLFSDAIQPIIIDFWEDISFGLIGVLIGLVYSSRFYDKIKSES